MFTLVWRVVPSQLSSLRTFFNSLRGKANALRFRASELCRCQNDWSALLHRTALEKICARIESYEQEIITLQRELTAIPALAPENGGEGEHKKAEYLKQYLEASLGCREVASYDAPDTRVPTGHRPNLVAKLPGQAPANTLWIMSHMDVVPPGDLSKWEGDPWQVRVQDGKIYGRGTEDNQQGIVSSLIAARAFVEENLRPQRNLGLVFAADEETGSQYGIQYVLEHHREVFQPHDFILIPDAGNEAGTLIEVAEKSIVWLKFQVLGKQTHGSTPERGVNALRAAAHLMVQLESLYTHYDRQDALFDPPGSTFEPTKIEANVPNVNTIPGEQVFFCDCRLLPEYDVDEFRRHVDQICRETESRHQVRIHVTVEQELRAAPPTPPDAPVVRAVERAVAEVAGVQARPMGIGGGTVAAFFRNAGFDTVVWATQDETLHEPNEYAKISNIINDAKVFAHVALQA